MDTPSRPADTSESRATASGLKMEPARTEGDGGKQEPQAGPLKRPKLDPQKGDAMKSDLHNVAVKGKDNVPAHKRVGSSKLLRIHQN